LNKVLWLEEFYFGILAIALHVGRIEYIYHDLHLIIYSNVHDFCEISQLAPSMCDVLLTLVSQIYIQF
jgi:hypothetical protein